MKSYVIIGLSSFGRYLAQFLSERHFYVIAVDPDEERVRQIKPFVTKGIIGNAKDLETLDKLGVRKADGVIVSLGEKVDDSMVVIYHLKELGVKNLYVNVHNDDHAKIIQFIEQAEVVFPEWESAYRLAQRIDNPNVLDYVPLAEDYGIIDWVPTEAFIGKTVSDLDLKHKYGVQIVSIEETVPDRVKLIPRGNHVLKATDVLVIIGKNEDLDKLKGLQK
jgi:trk system potassium uptake protein TrkA